mmetsp:Transcript_15534/g.31115  ORF Transcript_15534/g.31115 Transcript_15534/m.31115 type:complete len:260 (+) Transcript_15534:1349-2128(+)
MLASIREHEREILGNLACRDGLPLQALDDSVHDLQRVLLKHLLLGVLVEREVGESAEGELEGLRGGGGLGCAVRQLLHQLQQQRHRPEPNELHLVGVGAGEVEERKHHAGERPLDPAVLRLLHGVLHTADDFRKHLRRRREDGALLTPAQVGRGEGGADARGGGLHGLGVARHHSLQRLLGDARLQQVRFGGVGRGGVHDDGDGAHADFRRALLHRTRVLHRLQQLRLLAQDHFDFVNARHTVLEDPPRLHLDFGRVVV